MYPNGAYGLLRFQLRSSAGAKDRTAFFYKQLRKPFYEAGVEGSVRVIVERYGPECYAILAGNHNQVKRFLSNH